MRWTIVVCCLAALMLGACTRGRRGPKEPVFVADDAVAAAASAGPDRAHCALWKYLLLRQAGQAATANEILTSHSPSGGTMAFIDRLFDLFHGDASPEEVLEAAATDDQRAEAYYYLGRKALLDGRTSAAQQAFAKCTAMNQPDILETDFARALLKQVKARPDQ